MVSDRKIHCPAVDDAVWAASAGRDHQRDYTGPVWLGWYEDPLKRYWRADKVRQCSRDVSPVRVCDLEGLKVLSSPISRILSDTQEDGPCPVEWWK
jgi:hypothetical protein